MSNEVKIQDEIPNLKDFIFEKLLSEGKRIIIIKVMKKLLI